MFPLITPSRTHALFGKGFQEEGIFDLDSEDLVSTQPGTQLEKEANDILV